MKKILLILLCWASFANAQQTLFRVDCDDGNDSNDGTSWPGFLTLGAALTDVDFTEGDTLVSTGTCTESVAPIDDGADNNKMFWLDSLVLADGWDPTQIDTSQVWSTIVDASGLSGAFVNGNDDYWTIIGIWFQSGNVNVVVMQGSHLLITHCKISDHGDGVGALVNIQAQTGGNDSLITNLILANNSVQYPIWAIGSVNPNCVVINNTIFGDFTFYVRLDGTGTLPRWVNNLIQNISTVSSDLVLNLDVGSTGIIAGQWNYNLYWEATAITNAFGFNGATFDVLSVWADSVDNYLSGSEANSLNTDPSLQAVATTCYITNTSNAFETGTDLGFGTDIGYFQVATAAPAITTGTRKGVRSRWWH